jgi:hypothetical protein
MNYIISLKEKRKDFQKLKNNFWKGIMYDFIKDIKIKKREKWEKY